MIKEDTSPKNNYVVECNTVNERKRFIWLYNNEPLKNYSVSAVPCPMSKDRASQIINYLTDKRSKCNEVELRTFTKQVAYTKLIKFN